MQPKTRADFKKHDTYDPYQLALEDGSIVTFANPNRLTAEQSFAWANSDDPYLTLETLLGEDFAKFWPEWREAPSDEVNALLEDVFEHYGVNAAASANRAQRRATQRG